MNDWGFEQNIDSTNLFLHSLPAVSGLPFKELDLGRTHVLFQFFLIVFVHVWQNKPVESIFYGTSDTSKGRYTLPVVLVVYRP